MFDRVGMRVGACWDVRVGACWLTYLQISRPCRALARVGVCWRVLARVGPAARWRVLARVGSGRGSNGRGAPVGFIWADFQLKRSHGNPFRDHNRVFVQPVPTQELQGARKSPL